MSQERPSQESCERKAGPGPHRGSRIQLISTPDPHTRLTPGALGTITGVDGLDTISVRWDDGSRLGLIPDLDQFEILNQEPAPETP